MENDEMIRLIWDFRGPDSESTAVHHAIHLGEFMKKRNTANPEFGSEQITEYHWIAYMLVPHKDMTEYRDLLRPHRATLA